MLTIVDNHDGNFIVEANCENCGNHIEEVSVELEDDEIICANCGENIYFDITDTKEGSPTALAWGS